MFEFKPKIIIHWLIIGLILCLSSRDIYSQNHTQFPCCGINPNYNSDPELYDSSYVEWHNDRHLHRQRTNQLVTLPIVVHVIHNNGSENISDDLIFAGVQNLNDAFRNRGYFDPSIGEDTEIEFCLAMRDEFNNEINGIIRYESELTDMSLPQSNVQLIADLATFDPSKYINIRVVSNACIGNNCDVAGFGLRPLNSTDNKDGIYIDYKYFGDIQKYTSILVHEMGHFLSLHHTFAGGCINNNCLLDGDKVCDTPPDGTNNRTYCGYMINSCRTDSDDLSSQNPFRPVALGGVGDVNDDIVNYMDYSQPECQKRFTNGQKNRMHWFIDNHLTYLLNSKACQLPCIELIEANFQYTKNIIKVGENLAFTNTSNGGDAYSWYVNGVLASQDFNFDFQSQNAGTFDIELVVSSDNEDCYITSQSTTIVVECPEFSSIDYHQTGGILYFQHKNFGEDFNTQWIVTSINGDTLKTSQSIYDSIDVSTIDYIDICLDIGYFECTFRNCIVLDYQSGNEICGNELDDDGDGLIDFFDPDCNCNENPENINCDLPCQKIPDSFPPIRMKLKWMSEEIGKLNPGSFVVGDINNDNIIEIVSKKAFITNIILKENNNSIIILDGNSGTTLNETSYTDTMQFEETLSPLVIADTDRDSFAEIFFADQDTVYKYNHNLELQWKILKLSANMRLNICDFNQDGVAELYLSNIIINATNGVILVQDTVRRGCHYIFRDPTKNDPDTLCNISNTIASDFLPSPGLELAAGDIVYEVRLTNPNGSTGNELIPHFPNNSIIRDGLTSVGDINGDGQLDVVAVRGVNFRKQEGGVFVWDPRTGDLIAKAPAGDNGGVAFIGDVNNDCKPEIGVIFENNFVVYEYNYTQELSLLYSIRISDVIGKTSISMFDFNKDNTMELLHRDEEFLRIIDGPTGKVIDSIQIFSSTFLESPIVVDVDNDGQAEILLNGRLTKNSEARIFCYETATQPWAPARSVWNQYAYHVTNINDDLTVPRVPQNQAAFIPSVENCLQSTCPQPYNNFFVQSTTRSQNGCVQFGVSDLTISVLDYSCQGDSISVQLIIENISETSVSNTCISSGVYSDAQLEESLIFNSYCFEKDSLTNRLNFTDTIKLKVLKPTGPQYLYFTINDIGNGINESNYSDTGILECDYSNNIDSIFIQLFEDELNLGPDIIKCESEVFSINAGSGYVSYLWSDLSVDSIYSSDLAGQHYLEVIDECGIIHYDSINVEIDSSLNVDLGEDKTICPNQSEIISLNSGYDNILWSPSEAVSCDTCLSTSILLDTSFQLSVFVQKENCISFDTVIIEVLPLIRTNDELTLCYGENHFVKDSILSISGLYEFPLNDCDSILTIDLNILPLDTLSFSNSICKNDSVLFNGIWLSEAGQYRDTLINSKGCDSITMLNLSLINKIEEKDTINLCYGDSYIIWDEVITNDTSLMKLFTSNNGCDSIQEYQLVFNTEPNIVDTFYFCEGDSFLYNDKVYFNSERISNSYTSSLNCDSTYTAQLLMLPYRLEYDTMKICKGDSILINGVWVSEPTTILDTVATSNCNVIKQTKIEESTTDFTDQFITLCHNDSVFINNIWVKANTIVEERLQNRFGCDSIVFYDIRLVENPPNPTIDFDCEDFSFEIYFNVNTPWQFISMNTMDTVQSINYSSDTSFSVQLFSQPECEQELAISLPKIPIMEDISVFNDTLISVNNTIDLALNLDPNLWKIKWSPSDVVSCDTCFNVLISTNRQVDIDIELEHIPTECIYFRTFEIDIIEPEDKNFPNVFSPNDDGNNDIWEIDLLNAISPTTYIFDRWGNQIFSSTNSIVRWDGKFNGRKLLPGVYVYYINYYKSDGSKKTFYGDITLIK